MLIKLQVFFFFLIAPFIGAILVFTQLNPFSSLESTSLENYQLENTEMERLTQNLIDQSELLTDTIHASHSSSQIVQLIQEDAIVELQEYVKQQGEIESFVEASTSFEKMSGDLVDHLLATMLGDPIGQTYGDKSIIKVFSLEEAGYRGYMAKVRLNDPKAIKMVLANDQLESSGETTREAAERTGASLAINAGGFNTRNGQISPIGITVIDGEILTYYDKNISFIGFNKMGNLVGGDISSREQIVDMEVQHGASFIPTLLKDGEKQPIPADWANTRHPRTLIGHFSNGDLFFMVIDGRRQGWSEGVTLEEAKEKLLEFNIVDAYNLDGGGSTTFYYDGEVLNKPSGGQERKVVTNIVIKP